MRGMPNEDTMSRIHDLEVTVWVGKSGLDPVVDELSDQLADRGLVKVKFLRAARGDTSTDALAEALAERTGADLVDTRGHTAVYK
jgi:RNA-binding protein